MLDAENGVVGKHVTVIAVNLGDGRIARVLIRPELMNKLMSILSFDALNELVEAMTEGVESPDDRPACQSANHVCLYQCWPAGLAGGARLLITLPNA